MSRKISVNLPEKIWEQVQAHQKASKIKFFQDAFIDLLNKALTKSLSHEEPLAQAKAETHSTEFDYENYSPECQFGTYLKKQKRVLCDCTFPSILKRGRGKGRLIDPQICDACFPRIQDIIAWMNGKREENGIYKTDSSRPLFCALVGQTFKTKSELPCQRYSEYRDCPNNKCEWYP